MDIAEGMTWRAGGCHCGAVRLEALTPAIVEVEDCNCSMCARTGYPHLIVPAARFRLLQGLERLVTYTFNTGEAKHLFCAVCGVKSFYIPRSNPDGYSVNLRCLDDPHGFAEVRIVPFDGRSDWDAQAQTLAHKSQG
ncbi:MAG: GFA family protein [Alphaproteobacteria bacterium]|nr:GFA family protein [Alphaproteobacteria bacterium]